MKRVGLALALVVALSCQAVAQIGGLMFPGPGVPQASGACVPGTHAAAFLARTSGLSGTETTAYCNLINGLDTDGTFSLLDDLYIFATNTTTTANLNLISTSNPLTQTGTVTFSADHGYTGDGSTGFLSGNYLPGSGVMTQNSASLGAYVLNSRTTSQVYVSVGTASFSAFFYLQPLLSGTFAYEIVGASFPSVASASTQGAWIGTRTGATAAAAYKNGSSTAIGTDAGASSGLDPTVPVFLLAFNLAGTTQDFSADQHAAIFIGAGLTGTQAAAINNRINAYMTALGINVY